MVELIKAGRAESGLGGGRRAVRGRSGAGLEAGGVAERESVCIRSSSLAHLRHFLAHLHSSSRAVAFQRSVYHPALVNRNADG